jgi:zinc/manganese transport system permease protein
MLELMLPPFVACLVLVSMLAYLGVHVIAREVIFVDLSLAQMAALGSTTALLFGIEGGSPGAYGFALAFTVVGAAIFAATRSSKKSQRVPHEAIIGIVYVVASAATLLVADKAPQGAEAVKELLVGGILWVTWPQIARLVGVFAILGVVHWLLRDRFLAISFRAEEAEARGWRVRWWDFLFYLTFGVAITLAVPVAGVLLVFSFLVVPAVVSFLFTTNIRKLALASWAAGALASAAGLVLSFKYDLPTGPLIVCGFGALLLLAGVARRLVTREL